MAGEGLLMRRRCRSHLALALSPLLLLGPSAVLLFVAHGRGPADGTKEPQVPMKGMTTGEVLPPAFEQGSECPSSDTKVASGLVSTSLVGAFALVSIAIISARRRRLAFRARTASRTQAKTCCGSGAIDFAKVRKDFPALQQQVRPGVPLIYLDNAATSQKPKQVIAEHARFYQEDNSNVHRGMHTLSIRSTEAFEAARAKVARFINAPDEHEVIFTRNATEAINVVARTWGKANLHQDDEVILTVMEHHSNLVPWQQLAAENRVRLRFVSLADDGTLDWSAFEALLSERTRLVSMCHVSNVLGCVNPVERVVERAHRVGAKVLVDACQSVPHMPVDVQRLGADWIVASSHKMCGPTGIGFLWGRGELLRQAPPFLGGGEMIDEVKLDHSTYADIPHKLEAGTPAFAEAAAFGAACDYLARLGMDRVQQREHELSEHLWRRMAEIPGVTLYGPSPATCPDRASLVCFSVEGCHPHDLATLVDQDKGVAMRAGHHCTQPLHAELGISASARLSAYFYNTTEEIDVAVDALKSAVSMLKGDLSELDLLSVAAEADVPRWGRDMGPPTTFEALRQRGLLGERSTFGEAGGALSETGSRSGVGVGFAPRRGGPVLADLPGLLFLKWCQRYGHSPVCLVASAAADADATLDTPEEDGSGVRGLQALFEQVLDFGGENAATVVDDMDWLAEFSAKGLLRDLRSVHTELQSQEGVVNNTAMGTELWSWAYSKARTRCGASVQAGSSRQWPALATGLEVSRGDIEAMSRSSGCLELSGEGLEGLAEVPLSAGVCPPEQFHERMTNNIEEGHASMLLRKLTLLPLEDVEAIEAEAGANSRELALRVADEVTKLVHGEKGLEMVKKTQLAHANS